MDRNEIARRGFRAALGKIAEAAGFARKDGSGIAVPERLAAGGGGAENLSIGVCVIGHDTMPLNGAMAIGASEYMLGRMGLPFTLISAKNDVPAVSRNIAIQQAQDFKCAWALLVDARATFPPNAIPRLLELAREHKVDILGPTTAALQVPHQNLALPRGSTEDQKPQVATMGHLVEVDAIPPVLMMIRLAAIERLKRPYFRYPTVEEGWSVPAEFRYPGIDDRQPTIVPDWIYFCAAARRNGLKVWLDTELSAYVTNWGECGYQLTGSEDPDPEAQFRRVEHGHIRPPADQAKEAAQKAAEPKIEIAK